LNLGDAAPNFKTVTDAGDPFALSDLRGKVVVLNFWFTECGPCRIEMPEFQRIYSEHGGEDITILAVNRQDLLEKVEKFRDDFGLTFPIAMDPQASIQKEYRIPGYPTTFILNPQGVIVARQYGPLTVEQIRQLVNSALAG
jgi:peroxiredoxin